MALYYELKNLQTLLSETNVKVTDKDIHKKLLVALPATEYWHVVRVQCIEEEKGLEATVSTLLAYVHTDPLTANKPETANTATTKDNRNT